MPRIPTTLYVALLASLFCSLSGGLPPATAAEAAGTTVEAREFRLVDQAGQLLAELKSTEAGVVLLLYQDGETKAINLQTLAAAPNQGPALKDKARSLLVQQDYEGAIALLRKPANSAPHDFALNALLLRAEVDRCSQLAKKGDRPNEHTLLSIYERAHRLYTMNPTHPEPYYIIAKSLFLNGKPAKALDVVKKGVYYAPRDPHMLTLQGDIYLTKAQSWDGGGFELNADDNVFAQEALNSYNTALDNISDNQAFTTELAAKIGQAKKLKTAN